MFIYLQVPGGDERHMYNNSNDPNLNSGSPPHSFTGLPMPHGSFPMNMSFIPATTKGDSSECEQWINKVKI